MGGSGQTTTALAAVGVAVRVALVLALIAVVVPMVTGETGVLDRLLRRGAAPAGSWSEASVVFARDGATGAQRRALRAELQAHLAHHATLSVRFMRATVSDDPEFVETANAVLVRNTDDLRTTLQPAIGNGPADRVASLWERQSSQLFNYAAAVRDNDEAARDEATQQLRGSVEDISDLLEEATNGHLSTEIAAAKLQMQIDLLLFQIDAYAKRNYAQAYELEREAFANMYPLGAAISAAAAGKDPQKITTSPREEIASSIALLMDEHIELSVDVIRAGANGSAEFGAAAAALDANTAELTRAMRTMLGNRAAQKFNRRWVRHIDLLMRYTVAVAEDDLARRTRIQRQLDATMRSFGPALAEATNGRVTPKLMRTAMTTHQYQMLEQITSFVNADYAVAHDTAYDAFLHMNKFANRLGKKLGTAVSEGLPRGGAATGGGGAATSSP